MAVIKIKKFIDENGDLYVRNVNQYIYSKTDKETGETIPPLNRGGYGVDFSDPQTSADHMMRLKELTGKEHNVSLVHMMICYGKSVTTAEQACDLTLEIAELIKDEYQCIYGTHGKDEDHKNYHSHFGINPINLVTGNMMRTDHEHMTAFENAVKELTGEGCYTIFLKNDGNESKDN